MVEFCEYTVYPDGSYDQTDGEDQGERTLTFVKNKVVPLTPQIEDDDDFEDEPAVAVPVRDSAGFARKAGVWAVLGLVGVAIAVLAFAGFRQLR